MTETHRKALFSALVAYERGSITARSEDLYAPFEFECMEEAISAYMGARGVVMVPKERIEKLLEYSNSDYVPNVLFDQFRQFITGPEGTPQ